MDRWRAEVSGAAPAAFYLSQADLAYTGCRRGNARFEWPQPVPSASAPLFVAPVLRWRAHTAGFGARRERITSPPGERVS